MISRPPPTTSDRRVATARPGDASRSVADVRRTRVATWVYAFSLVWWAASWDLRNSVLMAWSPVEPIWIGGAAVALCVVHRLGRPLRWASAGLWPILVVLLGFLPGALMSSPSGYGAVKLASMVFVLLPVFCAATVLLDSSEARWRWMCAQALVGAAVAVAALEFNNPARILQSGRFSLATVDTISTSRLVGVAAVVLLVHGIASRRTLWWTLPLAAVAGVVVVQVGSRGPLLSVAAATAVVVLVGRCFAGRRPSLLLLGVVAAIGTYFYLRVAGGTGGARIFASLQSGLSDGVRTGLRSQAIDLGLHAPFGVGWGDFASFSEAGSDIANANGNAYAHNILAETFAEGGVLALLAFVVFAGVALVRLQRLSLRPQEAVALATLVYWLLNAQVSSDILGNRFLWITLACAIAAYRDRPEPTPPESRPDLGQPVRQRARVESRPARGSHT